VYNPARKLVKSRAEALAMSTSARIKDMSIAGTTSLRY